MFLSDQGRLWGKAALAGSLGVLICILTVAPAAAGQPKGYIPSLNATVEGLAFFESPRDLQPLEDRVYLTKFDQSRTRFISWELRLKYPPPGKRIDFRVETFGYNQAGKQVWKQHSDYFIDTSWTNSRHALGYGNDRPGSWAPGRYRVEVSIDGSQVAAGSFEVVSPKERPAPKGKPGADKGQFPQDLGEL